MISAFKRLCILFGILALVFSPLSGASAQGKRILFIPQDTRPISFHMNSDVIEKLGDEIVTPPEELLGSWNQPGDPDALWTWLEENAGSSESVVISTDAMIYGSLVASRKHNLSIETLLSRAEKFRTLHQHFPYLKIYAFSSIMRTPRMGSASGGQDASYYAQYGADIFRYTSLIDKQETEGLTNKETKEFEALSNTIPKEAMTDWMGRREKNFKVNEALMELANQSTFSYMILGLDDNAPYCQTHLEARHLKAKLLHSDSSCFSIMMGLDEDALMLFARIENNRRMNVPFIYTEYNEGIGADTIPSYCSEPIGKSVRDAIFACGGYPVPTQKNADLILLVNTSPNGVTLEANSAENTITPRPDTIRFVNKIADYAAKGYPIALGDISFGNGADNALMEELKNRNLLFGIKAYGGWNTATNTTGFLLGEAVLLPMMKETDAQKLLITRYLDDWAYQANVRQEIRARLDSIPGNGDGAVLNEKLAGAEQLTTILMKDFAINNILPASFWQKLSVTFPWNRTFEADYDF